MHEVGAHDPLRIIPVRANARRGAFAGTAALAVGTLVTVARAQGMIDGFAAALLAALALLALPVGRTLSERVFLLGTCALGWNCMLWWIPLPEGRVTGVLAVVSAAAVGWFVWALVPRRSTKRRLLPVTAWPDLLPPVAALVSMAVLTFAYLRVDNTSQLAALLPAWDNSEHYAMFASIWNNGVTQEMLPKPPGDQLPYSGYPQAFHATVTSVSALLWPGSASDSASLVSLYSHACLVVVGAASMVLVAGLTSIPAARRRMTSTMALAVALISVFSLGPGLVLHLSGFTAFWLPCVLTSCSIFIAVQWTSMNQTVHGIAMLGTTVAVAHGWILLLTMSLPVFASAILTMPLKPLAKQPVRGIALLGVTAVAGLAVLRAKSMVAGQQLSYLATPGAIEAPNLLATAVIAAAASIAITYGRSPVIERFRAKARFLRTNLLLYAIVSCMLTASLVAYIQIRHSNFPSYYFWKYLAGFELFSCTLLIAVLATTPKRNLAAMRFSPNIRPVAGACAILISALAGTLPSGSPAARLQAHTAAAQRLTPVAAALLHNSTRSGGCTPMVFSTSPSIMDPMNAQQWYLALRGGWTVRANEMARELHRDSNGTDDGQLAVSNWLARHPGCLLVSPSQKNALSASLRPAERSRLLRW